MNRRIERQRFEGIDRANALMETSRTRQLTAEEIEELKKCHTGYGGITWGSSTQFFTPDKVTAFATSLVRELDQGAKVLEFSCGSGAFIDQLYKRDLSLNITGIELSHELSRVASLCYPKANIICGDALEYMEQFKDSFDLIIGNPPFGKAPRKYEGFEYAKGKLEEYFVEMAVRCLKEGGEAVLIVPDGICANSSSAGLRKWLIDQCYYRGSVSLPAETFYFTGTQCKTTVIYFKKKYGGCTLEDYPVFMATCHDIGWNSRGQMTEKCDLDEIKNMYLSEVAIIQGGLFMPYQPLKKVSNQ